jgi:hypothetical protein
MTHDAGRFAAAFGVSVVNKKTPDALAPDAVILCKVMLTTPPKAVLYVVLLDRFNPVEISPR